MHSMENKKTLGKMLAQMHVCDVSKINYNGIIVLLNEYCKWLYIFPVLLSLLIESITGREPGNEAHIIIFPYLINFMCTFIDVTFHYILLSSGEKLLIRRGSVRERGVTLTETKTGQIQSR